MTTDHANGRESIQFLELKSFLRRLGLRRYEKGQAEFVPVRARAETFLPDVGYFSSRLDAERLVKAFA